MQQCYNCKCQVGSGVTVCPYCGTKMPVEEARRERRPVASGEARVPHPRELPRRPDTIQSSELHTEFRGGLRQEPPFPPSYFHGMDYTEHRAPAHYTEHRAPMQPQYAEYRPAPQSVYPTYTEPARPARHYVDYEPVPTMYVPEERSDSATRMLFMLVMFLLATNIIQFIALLLLLR